MNTYYVAGFPYSDELFHFGIKGQKWGIRRYQNPDGTLTAAGKARYGTEVERTAAKDAQRVSDARVAYGEGAGTRRKLLSKEITQKQKNKEYAKAYEEASKHVDVNKSLKRAEKLHKHSGTFVKGRDLADRGYSHANNALKTVGSIAVTALTTAIGRQYAIKSGDKAMANIITAIGGLGVAKALGEGTTKAYRYQYYEHNKKF